MTRGKNETFFCPLPWWHLSVEPTGKVFSCCNSITFPPLGDLHSQTAEDIWNGKELAALRSSFLKGECPKQCLQCVKEEAAGLISLRQVALTRFPATEEVITSTQAKNREKNFLSLSASMLRYSILQVVTPFYLTKLSSFFKV